VPGPHYNHDDDHDFNYNHDPAPGVDDHHDGPRGGTTIPAAGNWGMVILGLAFLGAIAWMVRARRSLR
jgi:LPXTG-motif cell wall-anchored protein